MSGCKKRLANHLVIENMFSTTHNIYKITEVIQNMDIEIECEIKSPRDLPFALISYRYMNDTIAPFEFLPSVDNAIIMEKHHSEITC